jgi:basic amino acid/polyamine antiporter, APA family
VLPLPARSGATVFGKTVETVLAERPCRVIIQADPGTHQPAHVPVAGAA